MALLCLRLFPLSVAAGLLWAADNPARHAVSGAVDDPSGFAIPNATVTLVPRNATNDPARTSTTAADGTFRLERVPAGRYRLEITRDGFETLRQDVRVGAGLEPLRVRLRLAHLQQELIVDSREQVATNPEQNQDALRLDRELLDGLPVRDRDILGVATKFLDSSVLSSGGPALVVDGMETEAVGVTASAIEEVRINADPYSAEYSRPGRGRIEVITKEGTNDYHGSMSFLARDHRWDARNAFAQDRPRQQRRSYEGHFTGPLGKSGKSTFLISAQHDEDDEEAIVFAQTPNGLVQQTAPLPQRDTEFTARLSRRATDKHTLVSSYSIERERQTAGVGGFELPEVGYQERQRQYRLYFAHKWFVSSQWFTDFSVRVTRERQLTVSDQPGVRQIVVEDAFSAGGAQQDEVQLQTELELAYISSWSHGKHFLRGGILIPDGEHESLDQRSNFDGTYRFASLQDFEAGRAFSFTQRQGESRLRFSNYQVAGFLQDDIRLRPNITLGLGLRYDHVSFLNDLTNFAPRMSLAWAVGKDRRTVVRSGVGVFHDRVRTSLLTDRLLFDGLRQRDIVIANPSYPDPTAGGRDLTATAPNVVRFAPTLRLPYLTQASFGVERELWRSLTLAANYTWVRGTKLFRSLDRNAPLLPEFERPDAAFGVVRELESSGTQKTHGLGADLRGRWGEVFRGAVLYRYGRSHDDTAGYRVLPPNSYDLRGEWARAEYDRRHSLNLLGTFALPWEIEMGTIFSIQSGFPYELTTGQDLNRDGMATERPEGVGRNALQGLGEMLLDLRLGREFKLSTEEGAPTVEIYLDAFNALNTVNADHVVGNLSSPFFGERVSAGPARRMQFGIEFQF